MGSSISGVDGGERGQPKTTNKINAVFTNQKDNSTLSQDDFMKLMVAQMQNQDFMNPMDDSQMVNQMVQFANMQQMQQMASWSRSNYAMSLIGKTVTASRFTVSGDLDSITGPVQRISLVDDEYIVYVGGKKYEMSEIMGVSAGKNENISQVSPDSFPLSVVEIGPDTAVLKWKMPTEDELTGSQLTYSVYYTRAEAEKSDSDTESTEGTEGTDDTNTGETGSNKKTGAFDEVALVENGKLMGTPGQKPKTDEQGYMSQIINGLEPDTTYHVNIVVTDTNGNKSVYKPYTFKTKIAS